MSDHQPGTSRGTKRPNEGPLRVPSKRVLLQESDIINALENSDDDDFMGSDEDEDFLLGDDDEGSSTLESDEDEEGVQSPSSEVRVLSTEREGLNETIEESALPHESPEPAIEGSTSHWSTSCSSIKQIPFVRESKLHIEPPSQPIDYFCLFFDEEYLRMIVECTNRYAESMKSSSEHRHARISRWKNLTVEEFKTFLGLLLHTGTAKMNRLTDYWKVHWLYKSCFSNYMSRNRFFIILSCLHFTLPNEEEEVTARRLNKCQKIVANFNNTMNNIYYPGKNLSLDESMVLWRGRLFFRHHIKGKRHKYDIKLYVLAEPDGLILNFHVFTNTEDETAVKGHTEKIVEKLMDNKLDGGHSIYMDNFYNSYNLASKLLRRLTYCTGTLNKKRKDNPRVITSNKLKRGENISRYRNGVHIGKWKDKREIHYISTEFADEMQEVTSKRGITTLKPLAILRYNENMSGVDLQDQMISYYPCERKTLRWYLKIFIHTMMMSLVNSRLLYNKFSGKPKLSLYDFRENIIEHFLPQNDQIPESSSGNRSQQSHRLTKIVKTTERTMRTGPERKVQAVARKDCRNCYKNKKRVQTTMECKNCPDSPPMCMDCFFILHTCTKK
ncbi:piggyBac transposable element-derived protein 4-like [Zerene cesonia]|uniref:piggyBac transposable element-derived protein 4-like n=1 Tax=Zerene cesonia TaxID=33412 RepID=UPI0018E5436D|nr:piggyBac transposable element-derived protein 4-like [Zerene cesonia]